MGRQESDNVNPGRVERDLDEGRRDLGSREAHEDSVNEGLRGSPSTREDRSDDSLGRRDRSDEGLRGSRSEQSEERMSGSSRERSDMQGSSSDRPREEMGASSREGSYGNDSGFSQQELNESDRGLRDDRSSEDREQEL
jgi:hypothetical protein